MRKFEWYSIDRIDDLVERDGKLWVFSDSGYGHTALIGYGHNGYIPNKRGKKVVGKLFVPKKRFGVIPKRAKEQP